MAEFKYEIVKDYGCVKEYDDEKAFEPCVHIIKWGKNGEPKVDIRKWSKDRSKMAKGISLSYEEAQNLIKILSEIEPF